MVRSYRKYEPSQTFGTICTPTSNCLWNPNTTRTSTSAGKAYVSANQAVLSWDIKTGELLSTWHDKDNTLSEVTCITQCVPTQPDLFAVGYGDGSIRIWDALSGQIVVRFDGHRSAVTCLRFDREGARLVSGSRDTDVIMWGLLAEQAEFRLRGHRDQITGVEFLRTRVGGRQSPHTDEGVDVSVGNEGEEEEVEEEEVEEKYLLTTSKDSLVKIWDLTSPHCVETHVAQTSGECWALGVSPDGAGCVTAGNDGELKVWSLDLDVLAGLSEGYGEGKKRQDVLQGRGILHRQGKDRTIGITFHPKQDYIAVHGSEKAVEVWRIRSADEVHKVMQRKRRRRREKAAVAGETSQLESEDAVDMPEITDVFVPYLIVRTGGRVSSVDWITSSRSSKTLQLLIAATNNQLETYTITRSQQASSNSKDSSTPDYTRTLSVELPGHRTDVRTLALSSDDRMLASASAGQLKVWNMKTRSCLRTLECGQALCSTFLPGDRIVLLGTKTGELELYDISTSSLISRFQAHETDSGSGAAIWTLALQPDGKGVITGGADKRARFWRFDVVDEEIPGTRRTTQTLTLTPTRHLKLPDDILSLCFSPDDRLLACSTLDNTVKVFFTDTLKLFLTLYGHKLPVLDMSIASDSKVIATSSADKNIRIWGLDFGDCHRALFAHEDSVMSVRFIPHPLEGDEKRILFSTSKDGVVKTWDAQKFEQVQRLQGHRGEVWALAVGRTGEVCVSASHDKSLRVWEVGDDLVFLEEERERELEEMHEASLARDLDRDFREEDAGEEDVAAAEKQTISTLTHGERVMEALEVCAADREVMQAYEQDKARNPNLAVPQRNPLFLALGNISAEQHLLSTLRKIPTPALNDALLVLPFTVLPTLFTFLATFLQRRMQPELAWRVTYFLLQVHMRQIVASSGQMKAVLGEIERECEAWLEGRKRMLGFNLAGLGILGREVREDEGGRYLDEGAEGAEEAEEGVGKGERKRGFGSLG